MGDAMTEAEWLACTDPWPMLDFIGAKTTDRKVRLFAAGCFRSVWNLLADGVLWKAVETSEKYADGLVNRDALVETIRAVDQLFRMGTVYDGCTVGVAFACGARPNERYLPDCSRVEKLVLEYIGQSVGYAADVFA